MGPTSTKLKARFAKWANQYKQQTRKMAKSIPTIGDVPDLESLTKKGHDPLHSVYITVQNLTSVFAESVSGLPELKTYYKAIEAAEDEYLPQGPPMSPLTCSYFTAWAFFDFQFNRDETIGTCLLDLSDQLGMAPGMVEALRQYQQSRMGIYEHCGNLGGRIRLRELLTDAEFLCHNTSGYFGVPGELWYVRLYPPLGDVDYHVTVTTPYILTQATKVDWTAYLNRAKLSLSSRDDGQRLYNLLKYGSWTRHWHEFVFAAYHHHQHEAIFLAVIPDVK